MERECFWRPIARRESPAPARHILPDTGSREENASKKESRASVLIQSESIML
jgi:hypothetical protein